MKAVLISTYVLCFLASFFWNPNAEIPQLLAAAFLLGLPILIGCTYGTGEGKSDA